ncbi:MAG TPA: heme lyase CcmF/NrfE family subunit [Candidatus Limnocylindria bacterium]|nr:heme lyase CcmF/NrfE family subunit [Candidatus Limnocylindria bacterium]
MIPTLGHAAVVAGLAATLFASAAFFLGGRRRDAALILLGRRAMYAALALAFLACGAMVWSLLTHDFSVRYVARNNATTTPPFYSVISLWAALEGSILFWTLLATGWAAVVLHRFRDRVPSLMPWVGLTLALGAAFFFAVMAWPGDPFVRTEPVGVEGRGPNALLQNHPFMGLHPPLLYLGYTGLAVPFAFGMAALVSRRTDEAWLGIVRRWTLVPWIFLTAGIVAGAWWSYEVLGWGGYWAWDPVENAALLPWLTATAFIHSSMVAERRGTLRVWTHALVIATFVLTLVGTFLTRSGVVESVHSFTASAIGPWFAVAIGVALIGSAALLLWRLPDLGDARPPGEPVSREGAFLFNNVLFLSVTFAVLFGTFYPMLREAFSGERVSLGAPWFNQVNAPVFAALLFLMGVGPALPWGGASWATVRDRFTLPLGAFALALAMAVLLGIREPWPLATFGLAAFVLTVTGEEFVRGARARRRTRGEAAPIATWRLASHNRRRYGGYVVHAGIALMAVAVAVSGSFASDVTATLRPGESVRLGSYTVTHERAVTEPLASDPRVIETRAELMLSGPQSGALAPALRDYPSSESLIATPAVRTAAGEDLYVTLLAFDPSGAVTLHVFVNPLVVWIWIGGGVVALGAVFAAWPARRRATAPTPVEAPTPAARPVSAVEGGEP